MQLGKRQRSGLSLSLLPVLLAIVLVTVVAGCGGGGDSSGTEAAAGSGSGGGSTSESEGGSNAAVVAAAEKAIEPYLSEPKSIGPEVPLKKKPPTGKTIAVAAAELPVDDNFRAAVTEAAKLLGWKVKGVAFNGTPEDTLKKMEETVREKPDGIIINGAPRETYESAYLQAKDANIPIVTQTAEVEGSAEPPFIAIQDTGKQYTELSEALANAVIVDSGGEADTLIVQYAEFPIAEVEREGAEAALNDNCPGCSTKTLLVNAADAGTKLPAQVISELQQDPSVDYLILQDASMTAGVDAALREAGLEEKVTVVGMNISQEAVQGVLEGSYKGFMAWSIAGTAYQGLDALARYFNNEKLQELPLIFRYFDKEALGSDPSPELYENFPSDLQERYKKLWLVK